VDILPKMLARFESGRSADTFWEKKEILRSCNENRSRGLMGKIAVLEATDFEYVTVPLLDTCKSAKWGRKSPYSGFATSRLARVSLSIKLYHLARVS